MRRSKIIEELSRKEGYAVIAEEYRDRLSSSKRFRLWTLSKHFKGEALRELPEHFRNLKKEEPLIMLGERYPSLDKANRALVLVGDKASSLAIRHLYLLPLKGVPLPKPKPFGKVRQSRGKVVTF